MTRAAFRVVAAALLLSATLVARPQEQTPPVLRSGVELVTVDVTVLTRGGEPLSDLSAADFTVTVDGAPRRIVALRVVRAGERAAATTPRSDVDTPAPPEPAPPSRRLFVMAVDRDHIPAGEGQQTLEAGARFIDALPAEDRVAIWTIPPSKSGLQFSGDREALKRELRLAVGTYRPPMLGGFPGRGQFTIGRDEALQIVDDNRRDVLTMVIQRECPPFDPVHPGCPTEVETSARTVVNDWRQRAQVTLTSLDSLVGSLGSVAEPKHLVLLTGGPLNTREELGLIGDVAAKAAAARVTIHALQVAEGPYQARATQMNATPGQIDQTLSAAYFLAGSTGGLAITPVSGDTGFARLTRELSASYEVAFETTPADRDGKLHRIDVRVRDRGWGSTIRARKTFRIDPAAALAAAHSARGAAPAVPPAAASEPAAPAASEPAAPVASEPAAPAAPPPTPERPEPLGTEVAELTGRLADYVDRFEREFSAVVAEERYVQMVHPWRGNPKGPDAEPRLAWTDAQGDMKGGGPVIARRQILSDILMVQARNQRWVAFRDVAEVDGSRIRDRSDRVRDLFLSKGPNGLAALREIAEESARYNLGTLRRNMNVPTLTLSFMRRADHWRYQFKRQDDETMDGRTYRVLRFVEKARPTLIGNANGFDIPIEGRIWLDAQDGRVARTEVRFDRGGERRVLVRAEFRPEPEVGVLVPARLWEWYEGVNMPGRIGGDKTLVQCLATYSNLRRFQVTTTEAIRP